MKSSLLAAAAFSAAADASTLVARNGTQTGTLDDVCTTEYVKASLPADNTILGAIINADSVTANAVTNYTVSGEDLIPDAVMDFCNVTFTYSHDGLEDTVQLEYWLPTPANYAGRFLATGGGGYAINSQEGSLPGGVTYGAAAGITDGGFGGFTTNFDTVYLAANGSVNYQHLFMFGYQAIGEMTVLGKALSRNFFGQASDAKVYTYYQGCSEGGREGWSQVQRWPEEYDGVIPGAPAFRYSQQQVNHLHQNVLEQTMGYYPPSCELDKIANETIKACDPLDGRTDGVVARSDLCKLSFNVSSLVGTPYSCAAAEASSLGFAFGNKKRQMGETSATPAQNGTISEQGVAFAQAAMDGLLTSDGKRAYFSYQPGCEFADGATEYNFDTAEWELSIASTGGEYITRFLQLVELDNLESLEGVTVDTLAEWMQDSLFKYYDTLQTTYPDLSRFQSNGGKILTFHGEQDDSIPTASSVRYHESVRSVMYPTLGFNESTAALGDWYRLFLVPGAAHCAKNSLQPNGPFPRTNLEVLIDWVENGVNPDTLVAEYTEGDYVGEEARICAWPLRPLWAEDGSMECVYHQESIDSFLYDLDFYAMPVY